MLIVSAFPGVGKSFLSQNCDFRVSDSDSSHFPKDGFPQNYINHIRRLDVDVALVSSHKEVRAALQANNMPFFLCYPKAECKSEYMRRYVKRGSDQAFYLLMEAQFENFVADCRAQTGCVHIEMDEGRYLVDEMARICMIALTGRWTWSHYPNTYTGEDLLGFLTKFAAYLTTLDKPIEVGASKDASVVVELLKDFTKQNGLGNYANMSIKS
jgi:hypothetical protein